MKEGDVIKSNCAEEDKLQSLDESKKNQRAQTPEQQRIEIQEAPLASIDGPSAMLSNTSSNSGLIPEVTSLQGGLTP